MTPSTTLPRAGATPLNGDQLDQFARLGYLVLPGFLPDDLVSRLVPEVDRWVDEGLRTQSIACCVEPQLHGNPPVLELELEAHGELIAHPPLMDAITQLMGAEFVFHHLHSDRQPPGIAGKPWHHDYEQTPQTDRTHPMVHALHYLDGLDEDTSSLAVLPGSHHEVAEKNARAHLGTGRLPGEVVIDSLPRGSTVVLHSALFHARRPRPDGPGKDRYFVDASYCRTGTLWPPVKPYWRHMLSRARELGLDRGRWPELFAERHFTEYARPS
ncbi:phytanoyl-CoA dioxygenase family protein [Streptomyces sp. Ru87]|uniref:phytanoyl-CoA dioxygenase family protein n=1 Tax=Streptomyces sp. Ru87 TaxID=2044307 RepID=UPI000BF5D252|nr:phytanoyl-CoA dioxygenase family protein [Streptomyces sp. Ru87]PGH46825.1 phytanoyl-CoA dioxygenase [Streptomyces sp. Ru87]